MKKQKRHYRGHKDMSSSEEREYRDISSFDNKGVRIPKDKNFASSTSAMKKFKY